MITVGIDEVGRGCWAGPLVAGAVVLAGPIPGLRDSKKLSKTQRVKLAKVIHEEAVAVGLGWVWPTDIDNGGITAAVKSAMQQALAAISTDYNEVIIDGNINYLQDDARLRGRTSEVKIKVVVKADDLFPCVSAASIVAKVARDQYMETMATEYPGYGFEQHVGYGTALHIASLKALGVTNIHRRSYKPIQTLLGEKI